MRARGNGAVALMYASVIASFTPTHDNTDDGVDVDQ